MKVHEFNPAAVTKDLACTCQESRASDANNAREALGAACRPNGRLRVGTTRALVVLFLVAYTSVQESGIHSEEN